MKLGTIIYVKNVQPRSIAAQKLIKNEDLVTEVNSRSTVNYDLAKLNKLVATSKVFSITIDRQNSLGSLKVDLHRYSLTDKFGIQFGTRCFVDDIQQGSISANYLSLNNLIIQVDNYECDDKKISEIYQVINFFNSIFLNNYYNILLENCDGS